MAQHLPAYSFPGRREREITKAAYSYICYRFFSLGFVFIWTQEFLMENDKGPALGLL